jgi:hypothetical protein
VFLLWSFLCCFPLLASFYFDLFFSSLLLDFVRFHRGEFDFISFYFTLFYIALSLKVCLFSFLDLFVLFRFIICVFRFCVVSVFSLQSFCILFLFGVMLRSFILYVSLRIILIYFYPLYFSFI